MSPEAFKHTLSREEFTKITVDDMASAKHTLDICFGKDTNLRKELLLDVESTGALQEEEAPAKKTTAKVAAKGTAKATAKTTAKATKKAPVKTTKKGKK
jgi:hypothetical protein